MHNLKQFLRKIWLEVGGGRGKGRGGDRVGDRGRGTCICHIQNFLPLSKNQNYVEDLAILKKN